MMDFPARKLKRTLQIGTVGIGGNHPVSVQSMTTTKTADASSTIAQIRQLQATGCEIVRVAIPDMAAAQAVSTIKEAVKIPVVADIHFDYRLALEAIARGIDALRLNPGNITDREQVKTVVRAAKEKKIPIRIGVNAGSLDKAMLEKHGGHATPDALVESALQHVTILEQLDFHDIKISLKANDVPLTIQSYRLMSERVDYPLHLGVTEAGNEDEGRIKSAVGIGTLLSEGIGDTIRVSLSEDPEAEIPVARKLISYIDEKKIHEPILTEKNLKHSPFEYRRRTTHAVENIGGNNVPVVIAATKGNYAITPDYYFAENQIKNSHKESFPIYGVNEKEELTKNPSRIKFLKMTFPELTKENLHFLKSRKDTVVILESHHKNAPAEQKAFFHSLMNEDCAVPVIVTQSYQENMEEDLEIKAGVDFGMLFVEGFGDGIFLKNKGTISSEKLNSIAFGILQATRARISKTEFISCPGCGRTMFDLQTVVSRIKSRTSHLKGLKIGIMGCIVNGIGEMADADYGYVGAGRGRVSLYKRKDCVEKNIPEEEAVEKLIELIKINGDWTEPIT